MAAGIGDLKHACINILSYKSDQNQISPCKINPFKWNGDKS